MLLKGKKMQLHFILSPEVQKALDQGKDVAIFRFNLAGIIMLIISLVFIWKVLLPFIHKLLIVGLERQIQIHKIFTESNMQTLSKILEHQKQVTIETISFSKKDESHE